MLHDAAITTMQENTSPFDVGSLHSESLSMKEVMGNKSKSPSVPSTRARSPALDD